MIMAVEQPAFSESRLRAAVSMDSVSVSPHAYPRR